MEARLANDHAQFYEEIFSYFSIKVAFCSRGAFLASPCIINTIRSISLKVVYRVYA